MSPSRYARAMAMPGHCVLYRFRVDPAREAEFVDAWTAITLLLRAQRGGLGSRLHRGDDGLWYAYAQWPSAEARAAAFAGPPIDDAARGHLRAAVLESLPELVLTPAVDLLVPSSPPRPPPPPWRLDYADGAGNQHQLACAPGATTVELSYRPITPATSSSGVYDGGPPRHAHVPLDDPRLVTIWLLVDGLLATARPDAARGKGTGAFTVDDGGPPRAAIVARGPALLALDALLAALAA